MTEETKKPEEVKAVVTPTPEVVAPVVEEAPVVKASVIEETAVEMNDEEALKEFTKLFADQENVALAEAAINNTCIEFEYKEEMYRVRKSTFAEKQEANKFRMGRFIELLKDKDSVLEKDLKALYKAKGIDIDDMDNQLIEFDDQQKALMLELGKAIKGNRDKVELEKYKAEIVALMSSTQAIQTERQGLLEYSLENRILMDVYSYMVWLIAEKKVGENWTRIWKTYDSFMAAENLELLALVTKNGAVVVTEEMSKNLAL